MRNKSGQFTKGYSGNPKGRPKKADEQILLDLWLSQGKEMFSNSVKKGEQWAIKLLIDKLYPNKKPVDLESNYSENGVVFLPKKQVENIKFTWQNN